MATPLINPLRVTGGTFYTFSSAVKDIQKTFTDDDARFVFSKFALLDIPNVATPSTQENYIVWEGLGAMYNFDNSTSIPVLNSDDNINLAQSFENYVLNFEENILLGNNTLGKFYDNLQLNTVSERIFWKWLTQLNAIRFRDASIAEAYPSNRYCEETGTQYYNPIVKYLGDIDIVNNVSRSGTSYSEIYINVPTQHGGTPLVLWKTLSDANYSPGLNWQGTDYISGRDANSVHPSGLDLRSFFDQTSAMYYITNNTFGKVTNQDINLSYSFDGSSGNKNVRISEMDGILLDFDPNSYLPIRNDSTISSISEFNATDAAGNFSFNAALIYYDTYSISNPNNKATNLYGILILDDFTSTLSGNFIKRFDKFKPNKITKLNGNGYSLKVDINFDTTVANAGVETIINDYNTFSMDLFIDASTRMQEAADMFLNSEIDIIDLKARVSNLESFTFTQQQLIDLSNRILDLEKSLNNAKLAYASSNTLLDLINVNADNINQILSGQLSVNLSYNTDVLVQGDGIFADKSVPNQITLSSKKQEIDSFAICSNAINNYNPNASLLSTSGNGTNPNNSNNNNVLNLGKFSNYYRQSNLLHPNVDSMTGIEDFGDNLIININDNPISWKRGQSFKIVFSDKINLNGFSIYIKTDSTNKFGQGVFGKVIGNITDDMLISQNPIIEIICIDENTYSFIIDIIR